MAHPPRIFASNVQVRQAAGSGLLEYCRGPVAQVLVLKSHPLAARQEQRDECARLGDQQESSVKTLFPHAGMHKTGSTSIQVYLAKHKSYFGRNDTFVVDNADPWQIPVGRQYSTTNCFLPSNVLIRNSLQMPARERGLCRPLSKANKLLKAAEINRFLCQVEDGRAVISAEAFSCLRTAEDKELYDLMFAGIDVWPMIYFRDRQCWLQSWKRQIPRNAPPHQGRKGTGVGIYDFSDASWLLDYDQIKEFFGPTGVYLDYDMARKLDGSVIPSFLRAMDLDDIKGPPSAGIFENRSRRGSP